LLIKTKNPEKEIKKLLTERKILVTPWIDNKYGWPDKLRVKEIDQLLEIYKENYPEYFI